ncbi:MAG: tubulin-like doman-containing protein [Methylovulum sp.]|nr:tubulin-like doman-containing protein [Methylovulum sp.]
MSNNHLIVGLGGTGGKTIKNLRKIIYEEFRCNDPNQSRFKPEAPIYLKYLYMDSNKSDLDKSEKWRTQDDIGSDIGLNKESQFSISQNNLGVRLNDAQNYPITHRYIGKKEHWAEIFSSMNINETAGGQIRRLGEALFEPECINFNTHVLTLTHQLEGASKQTGVQFHVCTGLAGGTGSGSFLHVIAQLRANFPKSIDYPIFLYLLLPEENSPWASNGDKTNYYANGYAALQELNAYLVSDSSDTPNEGGPLFAPIDLTGQTQRFENASLGNASKLKDRLQGCFILDNVNEAGIKIPVQEITQLFAQLLYQRIFLLDDLDAAIPQEVKSAISLENYNNPDEAKPSDNNFKLRTVRLQTFGVKKIVIPDEEIREHLSACFAEQAILQMLYNNWMPGDTRYRAEPKPHAFADFVQKEANRRPWKLTNNQITLSEGLLANEINANWNDISSEWALIANDVKNKTWEMPTQNGRDDRLDLLQKAFKDHYDQHFRNIGVEEFYRSKQDDLGRETTHVAEVSSAVHVWMYQKWQEGEYGFIDLQTLLNVLIDDTKNRNANISERLKAIEIRRSELLDIISKNKDSWGNVGILGKLAGRREALFDSQAECLKEYYELQTWNAAWRFAGQLLQRCLIELRDKVSLTFTEFKRTIEDAQIFFDKRRTSTCYSQESIDIKQNLIKFYEPNKVQDFCRGLLSSEDKQKKWAQRSRSTFINSAEENKINTRSKERYFGALLCHGDLKNILEQVARDNSQIEHDEATSRNNRLIGTNIVSRLAGQFQDKEKLRSYIRDIVASTQTFMRFNQSEITTAPSAVMAVILPRCEEVQSFRDELANLFMGNQTPGIRLCIVDSARNLNQISLISFKYGFPLRFLQPVQFLKEKYDLRLQQNLMRARLEVHIEDHPADRLPDLFRTRPDQIGNRILPLYQLALALGLLQAQQDPATNKQRWRLETLDSDGLPEYHFYPDEVLSLLVPASNTNLIPVGVLQVAVNSATEEQVFYLEKAVNPLIKSEHYKVANNRETLKVKLREQLTIVLTHRGDNVEDVFYIKLRESTKNAIALIDSSV